MCTFFEKRPIIDFTRDRIFGLQAPINSKVDHEAVVGWYRVLSLVSSLSIRLSFRFASKFRSIQQQNVKKLKWHDVSIIPPGGKQNKETVEQETGKQGSRVRDEYRIKYLKYHV
jgi:hypothetical protein